MLNKDLINNNYFNNEQYILVFDSYQKHDKHLKLFLNSNDSAIHLNDKKSLKRNQFYFGAGILLKYKNKYLLGRRDNNTNIEPNKLTCFSGHCSENPTLTQNKEFCEELLLLGKNKNNNEKRIIDIYHNTNEKNLYREKIFRLVNEKFLKEVTSFKPIYPQLLPNHEVIEKNKNNIYKVHIYIDGKLTMDLGSQIVYFGKNNIVIYRAQELILSSKHEITDMFFLESENKYIESRSLEEIAQNKDDISYCVKYMLKV